MAELKQLLKEDASGKNLYDHLTETLMKILIDKPKNAYDSFELISANVKANPLNPDPEAARAIPMCAEQLEKQLAWNSSCATLLKVPEEPADESGVQYPSMFPDDLQAFDWAGVSFGRGEVYRLYLSIKKLSEGLPGDVEELRLFGKIYTRGSPYYVVEGVSPEEEEGINERLQEGKVGVNKYAYWVSQNIEAGEWIKLPNVTMAQIVCARKMKKLLTGNLQAPVQSYPPFDGVEKNLLRAQIARIVGDTSISPAGIFAASEDDPPTIIKAEEPYEGKPASELKEIDSWNHHRFALSKLGRETALPNEVGEDGEEIVPEEEIEISLPLAPLKPEQWTFRTGPGGAGIGSKSFVVVKSLRWPGSVAIACERKFLNIYVGNAVVNDTVKRDNPDNLNIMSYVAYSPPMPGVIEVEWQQPTEEDGGMQLVEQPDVKADPTPPAPEGEEEEEG